MALVDYSSSESSATGEEEVTSRRVKRRKTTIDNDEKAQSSGKTRRNAPSSLPPLPSAFHDLYASTVRVSVNDDPTLHQGRKRVNPHRAGSWPSHLYIEWHPTSDQRTSLTNLVSNLQSALEPSTLSKTSSSSSPVTIHTFLTSDLGTPHPLHISLSRPIVLSTAQKDVFLDQLTSRIWNSGVGAFELALWDLVWHRTPDSSRSFLVLRVVSSPPRPRRHHGWDDGRGSGGGRVRKDVAVPSRGLDSGDQEDSNPELRTLLTRSNAVVRDFDQPALYASSSSLSDSNVRPKHRTERKADPVNSQETKAAGDNSSSNNNPFHISIAWSFAEPTAELVRLTQKTFHSSSSSSSSSPSLSPLSAGEKQQHRLDNNTLNNDGDDDDDDDEDERGAEPSTTEEPCHVVRRMRIHVDGIKAKIGNVVTHVSLSAAGGKSRANDEGGEMKGGSGLFGV